MKQSTMTYVAMDTHKNTISVAIAERGRGGEVRFIGEIPSRPESVAKMVDRLAAKHDKLSFCYEAGPCGYGLYRQITMLGHECVVVAPSLVPTRPCASGVCCFGWFNPFFEFSRGSVTHCS